MIPQTHKIDFSKCQNKSKGYDTVNETFRKYGKEWLIKEYVQEGKDNTSAKDIIHKAGGLQNLPQINQKFEGTGIVLDMNENIFTINHKIKLGNIAKKKLEVIKAEMEKAKAEKPVEKEKNGKEQWEKILSQTTLSESEYIEMTYRQRTKSLRLLKRDYDEKPTRLTIFENA